MLIIHTSAYAKKYRKLYIGLAAFVLAGDIMLISCYNVVAVYKNNTYIGSVTCEGNIYVKVPILRVMNTMCGFSNGTTHGIPIYTYSNEGVSVYGFMLINHKTDGCRAETWPGIYETVRFA